MVCWSTRNRARRVREEASMTTIADDAQRIGVLFNRIDNLDEVAYSFPDHDDRCERLLEVVDATLAEEAPIRPTVAASLLDVDEKTVREWADNGVLTIAARRPRLVLDPTSVYEISRLIRDLRSMDDDQELLDEMWHGITDRGRPEGLAGTEQASAVIPRQRSAAEDLGSQTIIKKA
jgi:hypothetical protein